MFSSQDVITYYTQVRVEHPRFLNFRIYGIASGNDYWIAMSSNPLWKILIYYCYYIRKVGV